MSDKEVTDKEIDDKLNEIMEGHQDNFIRLLAKLIFNLRFDLNEMKLELLKVFKPEGEDKPLEEVNGNFYT